MKKRIAFYGKGGIGKSTVAANTAAALALSGLRVLLIGCDPKADSTRTLMGKRIPSVLDILRKNPDASTNEYLHKGFAGVTCVESGGPAAGIGCAGRGIVTALEELTYHQVFDMPWDIILYDVLGDVVCGGFSVPMRGGFVDEVYLVTTSEYMSLYAANNILRAVEHYAQSSSVRLGGLIANGRSGYDSTLVHTFAQQTQTCVVGEIAHDPAIARAEIMAATVIQHSPQSLAAQNFKVLAQMLERENTQKKFHSLSEAEMELFCRSSIEEMMQCP